MTDQTTPTGITPEEAKKAREWALHALNKPGSSTTAEKAVARVVIGIVPEPRPTLADMTEEKRDECQWMQADTEMRGRVVIIIPDLSDGIARIMWPGGSVEKIEWERVTPRPDLPPMEWPGDQKPAPMTAPALPEGWRLADHPDYGRVIVTNTTPDPSGHVYFVGPADDSMGCDRFFCDPARLTYLDQGADQ